jgi:putative hydrolase of the HAD superfamily
VIRVISFDGDDTLWSCEPVLAGALQRSLEALQAARPGAATRVLALEDVAAARIAAETRAPAGTDLTELRRLGFAELLEDIGLEDAGLADHLTEVFLEHRSSLIDPYPDVLPTLDELAVRYRLGLVSNGNADTERCALRGRFAFRVHAHDHGVAKPDPAIFAVACRLAGCAPDEMVHVGDSLPFDVVCAQTAGIPAVWLNRDGIAEQGDVRPDAEIRGLDELPATLLRLGL